jgi:hypothetical protein
MKASLCFIVGLLLGYLIQSEISTNLAWEHWAVDQGYARYEASTGRIRYNNLLPPKPPETPVWIDKRDPTGFDPVPTPPSNKLAGL